MLLIESRFFEKSWFADKYETLAHAQLAIAKVEGCLQEDDLLYDPKLSLKLLADRLQVGKNTLSKTINIHSEMNFNDYINQKRVNEAKKRLLNKNYDHLTVEAIGNSVGFNSKSVFYSAFKKHANTSPSAFVKENRS